MPIDWNNAIISYSLDELRSKIQTRQSPGDNIHQEQIAIPLSPEVLTAFRASGKGWQSRIDEALKDWLKTHSPVA
jgi:uncharacterized protein (DUF4415 family)